MNFTDVKNAAACVLCLGLAMASPALAAGTNAPAASGGLPLPAPKTPPIEVQISPEDQKAENAYQSALQNLTPEQREKLSILDQQNARIANYGMIVAMAKISLDYCAKTDPVISKDKTGYLSKFTRFVAAIKTDQKNLIDHMLKINADEAPFMSQTILRQHQSVSVKTMMSYASQLAQQSLEANGYKTVDCAQLRQKLDGKPLPAAKPAK